MFETIAWISLAVAFLCAIVIAVDEMRHPQKMWIMNIVWPVTALYFSVFAVWGYFKKGRGMGKDAMQGLSKEQREQHKEGQKERARRDPTTAQTAISDSHCGAGCTLGDIISEFSLFGLGWTLFGSTLYAEFAGDLLLAWLLGIAFQYFTITPMRNLSPGKGLIAAAKADTLSILTFEIGLFLWMGLTYFVFFPHPASEAYRGRLLVHDADRHDSRLLHLVSDEPLACKERMEGGDGLDGEYVTRVRGQDIGSAD